MPGKKLESCKPFGNGHINDTYKVSTTEGDYILQRVNNKIFRIRELVANFEALAPAIERYWKETGERVSPALIRSVSGKYHYLDEDNAAWRLAVFIPGSHVYEISPDPEVSRQAARAAGRFQRFLNTLDSTMFSDTIPGFHNLAGRYEAYQKSLQAAENERIKNAEKEIATLSKFAFLVRENADAVKSLPSRVTHNDTKINNILFVGSQTMMIDLDTVMPGCLMYDYGDMVRTFTSSAPEDETNFPKVKLRIRHLEALTKAYLNELADEMTKEEKDSLFTGAAAIICEQAVRFLTDYLQGDHYYKISRPHHNLDRTRTQLILLSELRKHEKRIRGVIEKL